VPNSPGAGRKLQLGPGYDCCHGYHAEGCRVAPPPPTKTLERGKRHNVVVTLQH